MGNSLTVNGHLSDRCLESLCKLEKILFAAVVHIQTACISRTSFLKEFQRICYLYGICAVAAEIKLCIIEIVKIIKSASRTELDSSYFLKIYKINFLL